MDDDNISEVYGKHPVAVRGTRECRLPTTQLTSNTRTLLIAGDTRLGCTPEKHRVFTVFDFSGPGSADSWPRLLLWSPEWRMEISAPELTWTVLAIEERDVFRIRLLLAFEDVNEALRFKDCCPDQIIVEPTCVDHYRLKVFFPHDCVVSESIYAGRLLIEAPTQAERARLVSTTFVQSAVKDAVKEELKPYGNLLKKAANDATPPNQRQWWQNLRALHNRQVSMTDKEKWLEVAHIVVQGAIEQKKKPAKDRHSDYLSLRMLSHLLQKVQAPNFEQTTIEQRLAKSLPRQVRREEQENGCCQNKLA